MCLRSMWCLETQTGQARSHVGARQEHLNSMDCIPSNSSCSTQHVIALSSGEAELYATGRAAAGGLQSVQLLVEAGMEPKLEVLTDSSANLGMHNRSGSGRVRHSDVKWLWTQEAVQSGRFSLKKVSTDTSLHPTCCMKTCSLMKNRKKKNIKTNREPSSVLATAAHVLINSSARDRPSAS